MVLAINEEIHATKAHLNRTTGDNKKSVFKYIDNKQRKNNIGPLQDGHGHLVNREKTEMFNTFFASVVNTNDRDHQGRGSQCPELEDYYCEIHQPPVNPGSSSSW